MIDIENKVYTVVATALRTAFPNINISGTYVNVASSLPHVTICQIDNITYLKSRDDSLVDHHAKVVFEVNIYTSLLNGKKEEAKKIADNIDGTMLGLMFTRTTYMQTPNFDESIYRLTMRYEAVVGAGITSGTTTTHLMYRR